ncbi:MAG TPA: cyclopropane-fatty-acyl-phospholipid synthase family protein [Gaiellaceae bacterium]
MVPEVVDRVVASGALPDPLLRAGIRASCAARLLRERRLQRKDAFIRSLACEPVARATDLANAQHYEVPTEFFRLVLGPRLKYSSCWWPAGVETLAEAEEAMLELTCARAGVEDGMTMLDLGCGWGSLTLWLAEHYPSSSIVAVSNSRTQREWIESQGLPNVDVITADANTLELAPRRFDRILSVEMLEHMRNYHELLSRVATWLEPQGRLFVHVFTHRDLAYPYDRGWMTRRFFTAGTMPSHDLLPRVARSFSVERDWVVGGEHYARTADAWLERMDEDRKAIVDVLGSEAAFHEWRVFFLACAELWGFRGGSEWRVSHYRFAPLV